AAGAVFALWIASRKRIAAETIGRAEEHAFRLAKDAEREAENRRKEALVDAKEKAQDILAEAEPQARTERQQHVAVEQTLARREAQILDRQTAIERLERDLHARESVVGSREQRAEASAKKYDQLVSQQQHELERVASLTADEAKEILLRQIES